MTIISWVRVEIADIRPNGTERRYSQMWDAALCEVRNGEVTNTHTGKVGKLLDGFVANESGAPIKRVD